jgi:U3 small nucleolar ribonucleoprotein protein LCP5
MTDELPSELNALIDTISTSLAATTSVLPTSLPSTPAGLSLLDLKSSVLLSYIQHLSLLFLSKLSHPTFSLSTPQAQSLVWQLVQDRVTLEKGVLPLETKLGYQIRKLVRASLLEATESADPNLRYKPRPGALVADESARANDDTTGVYRPPRISSTALPSSKDVPGPRRNKVLEEFIATDLTGTPTAEPSIGSNLSGIRSRNEYTTSRTKDIQEYEEENFIRLPVGIGKEKGRKKEGFGGEDWDGLERIGKGRWEFGKKEGRVEKSRKRGAAEMWREGEGVSGQAFEKRKKVLQGRKMKRGSKQ